jgi:ribosomal protein S26
MGTKRRGRERLERCSSCGRSVPRDKAVSYTRRKTYSTDLKDADNVTYSDVVDVYYCISCAKHRGIFEAKKKQAQREREKRYGGSF